MRDSRLAGGVAAARAELRMHVHELDALALADATHPEVADPPHALHLQVRPPSPPTGEARPSGDSAAVGPEEPGLAVLNGTGLRPLSRSRLAAIVT